MGNSRLCCDYLINNIGEVYKLIFILSISNKANEKND